MSDIPPVEPDVRLAERLFERIRGETFDGVGVTRKSYGEGEQFAHDLVAEAGRELGLEVETDFAGNLYLTIAGRNRNDKRLVIGSHLDSVPEGGNFDGAAGVLAGLAVLSGFKTAGLAPASDVTVMAIRAEESGWFPFGYIGSRAALGLLPASVLDEVRRADSGRCLAEHMADLGFDPDHVRRGEAHLSADNVAAYIEPHIEQGPVLVDEGLPVAVVTGISGNLRWRLARITGKYGHSGGVPRAYRHDAAAAFINFASRVDERWLELEEAGHSLLATFCFANTDPVRAAFAKIPGEVTFGLDVTSQSSETLAEMGALIAAIVTEIESRRSVAFDLGENSGVAPFATDPGLRAGLVAAAARAGVRFREMASGAGHDTLVFGEAGIPAAMLFVRNRNDSHNPDESMEIDDFAEACRVLATYVAGA